ncbi:MAG: hypothetical protein WBQ18_02790 [Solirubrobacteraceae bacterium]
MSADPRRRRLTRAAALGGVSGLRTFTAPAVLAARGRWGRGPVSWLVLLAGGGELIADKLPMVPARSEAPSLLGRILSGTAGGAEVGAAGGAGVGAASAAATTYASQRLRAELHRRTGLPDPVLGLAEDAVAVAIAYAASRPDPEPAPQTETQAQTPEPPRLSPAGAAIRGLAAAAVGTAAMTSVQMAYLQASGASPSGAPGEAGRRVIEGVAHHRVSRRRRGELNEAMHVLYGTAWGLPLGLVAASLPRRPNPIALGGALTAVVWGAGLVGLPALDLAPPVTEQSAALVGADLAMHLAYGAATSAAWAVLSA